MHPLTDTFIKSRPKLRKIEGQYFDKATKPKGACHYGALYWGVYGNTNLRLNDPPFIWKDYPELLKIVPMPCEDSLEKEGEIRAILIHLNDFHDGRSGWTDKKVAEWLDTALNYLG